MNATSAQSNLISIAEAARLFGVHRRTIERWIQAGQLSASPSEGDRRKRLVDRAQVETLAQESAARQSGNTPALQSLSVSSQENDDQKQKDSESSSALSDFDQEVIDNALQLIYSHHYRTISQLYPEAFQPLTLDQLRNGPLGQDLARLARIAEGQLWEPRERVLEAIDSILQLFFWPAAAEDFSVPRRFWDTDFGRLLARAKYRTYKPDELISIGEAAQLLGVTRPIVYRWLDDRTLSYARDEMSGRTFVVRRDVEKVIHIAKLFSSEEELEPFSDRGDSEE